MDLKYNVVAQNKLNSVRTSEVISRVNRVLTRFVHGVDLIRRDLLLGSMQTMWGQARSASIQTKVKARHEASLNEFKDLIILKEKEVKNLLTRLEEMNKELETIKKREMDLQNKLKAKEQKISSLEETSIGPKNLRNSKKSAEEISEVQMLQEQISELEIRNSELKEKISSTEGNVTLFIREMSELLDAHEISTNAGSEDNNNMSLNSSSNHLSDEENIGDGETEEIGYQSAGGYRTGEGRGLHLDNPNFFGGVGAHTGQNYGASDQGFSAGGIGKGNYNSGPAIQSKKGSKKPSGSNKNTRPTTSGVSSNQKSPTVSGNHELGGTHLGGIGGNYQLGRVSQQPTKMGQGKNTKLFQNNNLN